MILKICEQFFTETPFLLLLVFHKATCVAEDIKFLIKDFFSKCEQIRSFGMLLGTLFRTGIFI